MCKFSPPQFSLLTKICLLLATSMLAIWLSTNQIYLRNAIVNVVVAYPFFLFGLCMQNFRGKLNNKPHLLMTIAYSIACALTIGLCAEFNGYVWVYENGFGNNYLLYLLGGIAGTCCLYGVSILLNDFRFGAVVTISKGTIVVLGLHIYIIYFIKLGTFVDYLTALLLTLLFIPIIKISEVYFPWLIGKYRAK